MSKFKITSLQLKTSSTNKQYALVDLTDEQGKEALLVSIWDKVEELKEGEVIDGNLTTNAKGYTNFRFTGSAPAPRGGSKTQEMNAVMDRKRDYVNYAMDKKQDAIKMSGAMRDATLIITSFYPEITSIPWEDDKKQEFLRTAWKSWRDFFINSWEEGTSEPFN